MSTTLMTMQHEPSNDASSRPVAPVDLRPVIANSDLIVAATVLEVHKSSGPVQQVSPEADPKYDQLCQASVEVGRTLVGARGQGPLTVLFLQGKVPARMWTEFTAGQTVLMFLRFTEGFYVPAAPREVAIPTLREIAPQPLGASRTKAVAHELEHIVFRADPASNAWIIVQAAVARAGLPGEVDLGRLATPALHDSLRRTAWVAIAMAEGQLAALDELPSLFASTHSPAAETLRNLIVQKVRELREVAALPQLATLLRSPKLEMARAAAVAVRQLQCPAAIPDLMRALDYPNQDVRYHAVMGLAELEPSVKAGPSFELFRRDESPYIEQWKRWWNTRRAPSR